MSTINNTSLRSAWSQDGDKAYLKEYLNSPATEKIEIDAQKTIKVSENFKKDFVRLGSLEINKEPILSAHKKISAEDEPTLMRKVCFLVGGSDKRVQKVTNLLFQGISADAIIPFAQKLVDLGMGSIPFDAERRHHHVQVDSEGNSFQITHEFLYKYRDAELPKEQAPALFYVKEKVLISGKLDDLESSNADKLSYRSFYTGISTEREKVETARYGGMFGAFNSDNFTTFQ